MKSLATVARIKMADDSLSSLVVSDRRPQQTDRLKIIQQRRALYEQTHAATYYRTQAALSVSNECFQPSFK